MRDPTAESPAQGAPATGDSADLLECYGVEYGPAVAEKANGLGIAHGQVGHHRAVVRQIGNVVEAQLINDVTHHQPCLGGRTVGPYLTHNNTLSHSAIATPIL